MKRSPFFPLHNHKHLGRRGWIITMVSVFGLPFLVSLALLSPVFAAANSSSSPTTPNTTGDDPGRIPAICPVVQPSDPIATPVAGPPPLTLPQFITDDQNNILGFVQLSSCNRQVFGAVTAMSSQPMSVFLTRDTSVQPTAVLTGTYVSTPPLPFDTGYGYCAKGTITVEYGHSFSNTACDN